MTFQYTLTLSDTTGVFSSQQATAILANARGAMEIFSRHIEGQGVLNVVITADLSGRTVGSGRSLAAVNKSIENGKQVIHEGAVFELITGSDPNGDAMDVEVTLPLAYLTNSLWLDPDPTTRSTPVQAGKFDFVSFFLHEVGHALGFNGRGDLATGVVSGQFLSTYDALVQTQNGFPVFTGANAMAVYGGPVPLSTNIVNSYTHLGRVASDGLELNLMEGSTFAPAGFRWYVDQIELAVFRDLGLTTVASPIADVGGSRFIGYAANDTLTGGVGADTLNGGAGDNRLFGAAGSDSINTTAGTNYLRGDEGDDYIVGGVGFDDINGNMGNDTCVSGGGDDWVVGGKDNDSLVGSAGQNLVYGNLGNDTCAGGDGADTVRGGQGDDLLSGGGGNDFLSGDRDNDTMSGGAGADIFSTHGEAGIDRVTDFNLAEGDRVNLAPGTQYTVSQVGADTVINMTGGGQMILVGVASSPLTGAWIFGN